MNAIDTLDKFNPNYGVLGAIGKRWGCLCLYLRTINFIVLRKTSIIANWGLYLIVLLGIWNINVRFS